MTVAQEDQLPQRRAPEARPVNKLRVLEWARELNSERELLPRDALVVQYLAEITDKDSGLAIVEIATIAVRIGASRPTVVGALKRLIDAGLITREPRRKANRCFATAYRLADMRSEMNRPRCNDEPTPVHGCTTSRVFEQPPPNCLSRGGMVPSGERHRHEMPAKSRCNENPCPVQQDDEEAKAVEETWIDLGECLAGKGQYARWRSGPGEACKLAKADLERWRAEKGDHVILEAIRRAPLPVLAL